MVTEINCCYLVVNDSSFGDDDDDDGYEEWWWTSLTVLWPGNDGGQLYQEPNQKYQVRRSTKSEVSRYKKYQVRSIKFEEVPSQKREEFEKNDLMRDRRWPHLKNVCVTSVSIVLVTTDE